MQNNEISSAEERINNSADSKRDAYHYVSVHNVVPKSEFPKERIVLLDGTVLECFPKETMPETLIQDELTLDTTGKYLQLGRHRVSNAECERESEERAKQYSEKEWFAKHAFFLLNHADRIMHDSRMFLATVKVNNGLMYMGTSGFHSPTLGVYIEWWLYSLANVFTGDLDNGSLIYHLAGSPLSGMNTCGCVHSNGIINTESLRNFKKAWMSFVQINKRYNEAKQMYQSYTIDDVLGILQSEEQDELSRIKTKYMIQQNKLFRTEAKLAEERERYDSLNKRYKELCIKHNQKELEDFKAELQRREAAADAELASISQTRSQYKKQLKSGQLTPREYQNLVMPLSQQRVSIKQALFAFRYGTINYLTQNGTISSSTINEYINADCK